MSQSTEETGTSKRRFTKLRAILAGGLVLGVGAAITLAVWNDSEVATGNFASGEFGIEGSADEGTTWADHTSEPGATLNFQLNADSLSPDDSVYAGFGVRLAENSDYAADVTIEQDTTNAIAGTSAHYVYTTTATCDATTYAAGTNDDEATFSLAAIGAPVYVCFQVTADDAIEQGTSGSVTWTFTAESADVLTPAL